MISLVVRRTIRASAARLFDAWTRPEELRKWWGPESVVCIAAEVDLRVGGRYRIGNRLPNGRVLWISGEFEIIERPSRLAYTWRVDSHAGAAERVVVSFKPRGAATEVIVTHRRIPSAAIRKEHARGWRGCLAGLLRYASPSVD